MKKQTLKNLSRSDLLEILIRQNREIEELQQQLAETQEKLQARELSVQEAGSLADAALKVNGVFEAAQAACDQYIYNIKKRDGSPRPAAPEEKPAEAAEKPGPAPRKEGINRNIARPEYWSQLSGQLRVLLADSEKVEELLAQLPRERKKEL